MTGVQTCALPILDTLADHLPLLTTYRQQFKLYKKNLQHLLNIQSSADEARSRQDYEQFLFNELENANLKEGEQAQLEIELEALNNSESIKRGLLNAYNLIDGEETAVLPILKEVVSQIQTIEKFNPLYSALNERLRSSLIEIKDIAQEASGLEEDIVFNPARIEDINLRLDTIYTLQQKRYLQIGRAHV